MMENAMRLPHFLQACYYVLMENAARLPQDKTRWRGERKNIFFFLARTVSWCPIQELETVRQLVTIDTLIFSCYYNTRIAECS